MSAFAVGLIANVNDWRCKLGRLIDGGASAEDIAMAKGELVAADAKLEAYDRAHGWNRGMTEEAKLARRAKP